MASPTPGCEALAKPGAGDQIADGEILLGYENGYGKFPLSPEVPADGDPDGVLPPAAPTSPERRDFGRNGSYLVFRQLAQDVSAFWKYVYQAKDGIPGVAAGREGAEWLASRMVGRWQNGTPITRYPHHPGPEKPRRPEPVSLLPASRPRSGRCVRQPLPHRLAHPADQPARHGAARAPRRRAQRVAGRSRRCERSGSSCPPSIASCAEGARTARRPTRIATRRSSATPTTGRGALHFLCFNANLSRQFEFVQSNWALNPSFAGLSGDPDPLLAAKRRYPFEADSFTMQGCPTRRVHDLPRVVETRGAAYFFMPSRAALEYLSASGPAHAL